MSFRLFIYYCALCGGWAAFLAWAVVQATGIRDVDRLVLRAALVGGVLGMLVAGAVGLVDALLNAPAGQRLPRVATCLGLGLVGGMAGGLVGEILSKRLGLPFFLGWALAGVLVGASVGAYDLVRALGTGEDNRAALRKTRNGVYGGLVGGFVGGVFFELLVKSSDTLPRSNLTIGLVILGVCIGLFVGLAQVILKEAWLKVERGFRAGRELLLTKDQTTIGRAEGCDVGLFGDPAVERLHARIVLQADTYLLAHAAGAGHTLLNDRPVTSPTALRDGDVIRVGKSVLRFGERQKRP
jgi:hypothetical protein